MAGRAGADDDDAEVATAARCVPLANREKRGRAVTLVPIELLGGGGDLGGRPGRRPGPAVVRGGHAERAPIWSAAWRSSSQRQTAARWKSTALPTRNPSGARPCARQL